MKWQKQEEDNLLGVGILSEDLIAFKTTVESYNKCDFVEKNELVKTMSLSKMLRKCNVGRNHVEMTEWLGYPIEHITHAIDELGKHLKVDFYGTKPLVIRNKKEVIYIAPNILSGYGDDIDGL